MRMPIRYRPAHAGSEEDGEQQVGFFGGQHLTHAVVVTQTKWRLAVPALVASNALSAAGADDDQAHHDGTPLEEGTGNADVGDQGGVDVFEQQATAAEGADGDAGNQALLTGNRNQVGQGGDVTILTAISPPPTPASR